MTRRGASNNSIRLYAHNYVNYLVNFTSDDHIRCLALHDDDDDDEEEEDAEVEEEEEEDEVEVARWRSLALMTSTAPRAPSPDFLKASTSAFLTV